MSVNVQFKNGLPKKLNHYFFCKYMTLQGQQFDKSKMIKVISHQFWMKKIFPWKFNLEYGGTQGRIQRGRTLRASPLKLEKIRFFGVKSWFFTRNTPQIFAPPSAVGKISAPGTFTKLSMHVSSRNTFPTTRNLQIRVHVYCPRLCCGDWSTFVYFVPMIDDHGMTSWRKDKQSWMLR